MFNRKRIEKLEQDIKSIDYQIKTLAELYQDLYTESHPRTMGRKGNNNGK